MKMEQQNIVTATVAPNIGLLHSVLFVRLARKATGAGSALLNLEYGFAYGRTDGGDILVTLSCEGHFYYFDSPASAFRNTESNDPLLSLTVVARTFSAASLW